MKTKIIPFDLEMAKKIQAGEIKGRIVTTVGGAARIVCFDKKTDTRHPLVVLIHDLLDPDIESVGCYTTKGEVVGDKIYNLCIELPEETPKQKGELTLGKWKEGDEVWIYSNYEYGPEYVKVKVGKYSLDTSSGHRRNIIFENGFTCQELVCQTCWYENPDEQKTKTKEFKPFDKVLVRNEDNEGWQSRLYDMYLIGLGHATQDNLCYEQCIPYEGNQELVGTTKTPKDYGDK